ncbi:MAG: hypothetical protein WCT30_07440 [Desulfurivibrionaceae bacterium]
MRDDTWGDFGNTVTMGTLSVKFISQGKRRGPDKDGGMIFFNAPYQASTAPDSIQLETEEARAAGAETGLKETACAGSVQEDMGNVFFLTFIR